MRVIEYNTTERHRNTSSRRTSRRSPSLSASRSLAAAACSSLGRSRRGRSSVVVVLKPSQRVDNAKWKR